MAGAAAVVLVLWGLLSWPALLKAIGASGPGDPRVAPFLFLVVGVFELIGLPLGRRSRGAGSVRPIAPRSS